MGTDFRLCRVVLYFVEVVVKSLAKDPVFFHRFFDTDVRVALSLFRPALTLDMAQADVQCWPLHQRWAGSFFLIYRVTELQRV